MLRSTLVQAGGNFNPSKNPVFHKESLTLLLNIKDACKLVTYQTCTLQKCQSLFFMRGAREGVVTALVPHQYGPGLNPGIEAICGLNFLLVLSLAVRGFSVSSLVFPFL